MPFKFFKAKILTYVRSKKSVAIENTEKPLKRIVVNLTHLVKDQSIWRAKYMFSSSVAVRK